MDKKVKLRVRSGCDYYEPHPFKVDESKTEFLGECACGQGGCYVVQEYELLEDNNTETSVNVD